jgi:hypothetical protein
MIDHSNYLPKKFTEGYDRRADRRSLLHGLSASVDDDRVVLASARLAASRPVVTIDPRDLKAAQRDGALSRPGPRISVWGVAIDELQADFLCGS